MLEFLLHIFAVIAVCLIIAEAVHLLEIRYSDSDDETDH